MVAPLEEEGAEVLLAQALPQALRRASGPGEKSFQSLLKDLAEGRIDLVVFTSRPAVESLIRGLKRQEDKKVLAKIKAASLGPLVSRAVRDAGLELVVQAREPTPEAMVEAILLLYPSPAVNADVG
jgi:uroporphyrinogen-III synthase